MERKIVVVVGLGMVGLSFIEKILEYDTDKLFDIITFSEESFVAYNRVGLTQYFKHRDVLQQLMQQQAWYQDHNVSVHLGDRVISINHQEKTVTSNKGKVISYDYCIMSTGSTAAVPTGMPGFESSGVFVYRTIDDLDSMISYSKTCRKAAVVGGGLLGLEAAKAAKDLGLEVTVFDRSNRLMSRQLDVDGSRVLQEEIEKLGISVVVSNCPKGILHDNGSVTGLTLQDDTNVDTNVVIYAIGIRPRSDLASASDIEVAKNGGVITDDYMQTSAPDVFAIGECVSHADITYGLVAPGYEMAEVVARNLTSLHQSKRKLLKFKKADTSTKLKLLGVNVASFGDYFADEQLSQPLVYRDPFSGIYKKYLFTKDGKKILGGMMVGDTKDYAKLLAMVKSQKRLLIPPSELILGAPTGSVETASDLPDETQICSCNNICKGDIRRVIKDKKCLNVNQVKGYSKAGSGCGGCLTQVQEIFEAEMKAMGQTVKNSLCVHFEYSRPELWTIVKVQNLKTFSEIAQKVSKYPDTTGCEVCKPAVASILAGLWNDHILNDSLLPLQDTNDRYLANIQRGGLYSVIPRIAAGEVTPEKLEAIAKVAMEYSLYTKITGAQRIDIMGAKKEDLPNIWEKLVDAGFESGHAYGKSLRAVKSCVGTTWCRYGQQDSVGFAITLENRYKGIRSPHKLKGGVSGCIRECAEAQGKDFGCIATDKGYNLYVGGNGGSKPRHAELLAADIPENLVIKYLDRFLMYYITTADKLTRTARWIEKLEGGIQYLKKVVVDDYLGIGDELEAQMQLLINSYECEWTKVIKNPKARDHFKQFVNSEHAQPVIEMVKERDQVRPASWPKDVPAIDTSVNCSEDRIWFSVGPVSAFPQDQGKTVRYGDVQIAVFHKATGEWYATQNICPHKRALVLSSGLLGSIDNESGGDSYVSCPMHKKNFSLKTGKCLVPGEEMKYKLMTFEVKIEDDQVYLRMPKEGALNQILGTDKTIITSSLYGRKPHLEISETPEDPLVISELKTCGSSACGNDKLEW
ncbi:hypothetical protein K450DRAFT_177615 [Umbelopsis ramanniana AG]|uniref:Rieske domain-containing protein n=1 Tax=Umbelopsis ramanniana AG TaxID=1314678 RepID=A0AAD5E6B8_UMBRA|nr:uncharacterized protein K450DRAFT_177615 [Umbelopsis ramanniana AG]KAI8577557.1 hypothetical protein K450DRAFT_177615 [Umbelopsis ramanniana AG]